MGSICGSEAAHSVTSEELRALQASVEQYKKQTLEYQSRLQAAQSEMKSLSSTTETPKGNDAEEVEKMKDLLNVVMKEGWTQLRALEKALDCEERLKEEQDKEGLNNIEEVDVILKKRSAYRSELARKLSADRDSIRTLTTTFWLKLEAHYRLLGKTEGLSSPVPRTDAEVADSLDRLLTRFSVLCQEYINLAENSHASSKDVSQNLAAVRVKKEQFETKLKELEERNQLLAKQSAAMKSTASELQVEVRKYTADNADLTIKNKEATDHAASLEEDLTIKRSLLVHVKDELAAAERKNRKLKEDLDAIKARQSGNQLATEMNHLEEEKCVLLVEISEMERELSLKQGLVAVNKKKIKQLEDTLRDSEEKAQNPCEADVRMLNMQSTLQELYKSIEDNGDEDDM